MHYNRNNNIESAHCIVRIVHSVYSYPLYPARVLTSAVTVSHCLLRKNSGHYIHIIRTHGARACGHENIVTKQRPACGKNTLSNTTVPPLRIFPWPLFSLLYYKLLSALRRSILSSVVHFFSFGARIILMDDLFETGAAEPRRRHEGRPWPSGLMVGRTYRGVSKIGYIPAIINNTRLLCV